MLLYASDCVLRLTVVPWNCYIDDNWAEVNRIETSWEELRRGGRRWEPLRRVGKKGERSCKTSWGEVEDLQRAAKIAENNWLKLGKELKRAETRGPWEELQRAEKSLPQSTKLEQEENELTEQSWEDVRHPSSFYRQNLSFTPIAYNWKLPRRLYLYTLHACICMCYNNIYIYIECVSTSIHIKCVDVCSTVLVDACAAGAKLYTLYMRLYTKKSLV